MKKYIVSLLVFVLVSSLVTSVAFAFTTIKVGAKGATVKKIQQVLKNHNFKLKVDGKYGASTAKLVKAFQKMHHITQDGKVGQTTWNFMMNKVNVHDKQLKQPKTKLPLTLGAQNDDVKFVQQILKAHRYPVKVDGKYGSSTVKYVKLYQKAHFLSVDGKVGEDTWESMAESYKIYPYKFDKAVIVRTPSRFPINMNSGSSEADVIAIKKALEQKDPEQDLVLHTVDGQGQSVYTGVYDQVVADNVYVFQLRNGIKDNAGEVGMSTWEALVATEKDKYYVSLIAKMVSLESGGANENERLAIANVIIDHANYSYGGNIEKEIRSGRYDPCNTASEWVKFQKKKPGSQCVDSAKKAYYANISVFGNKKAYWFHVERVVPEPGNWRWKHQYIGLVDKHVFWGL